jgi:hypothetical protein
MPRRVASTAELPLGREASGFLSGLMAWERHAPAPARPLILRLHKQHHADLPEADEAVRQVWHALAEAGALDAYEAWRAQYRGAAGWPTREREERRREVPAT